MLFVNLVGRHMTVETTYKTFAVYEYLERLEGKIRKCLFFYVEIFKNNSVLGVLALSKVTQQSGNLNKSKETTQTATTALKVAP